MQKNKFLYIYTCVIAQNTSFNLTNNKNKTPHFFALITLFNNAQTESIRN